MLFQINTRVALGEIRPGATFDDFPDRLWDELAQRGLRWVWPLGIWQTGSMGRDVSRTFPDWQAGFRAALPDLRQEDVVGSPFAIASYTCNKDFGGEDARARLRDRLRKRGLKMMLDFVPNHVALDHPWVKTHPEWLIQGTEQDLAQK